MATDEETRAADDAARGNDRDFRELVTFGIAGKIDGDALIVQVKIPLAQLRAMMFDGLEARRVRIRPSEDDADTAELVFEQSRRRPDPQ